MLDRLTIERMRACGGPVLVALSGGGDSVALLRLLVIELGADAVRAGVVDHALRDGSDADARRALGFAEALGVRGTVLTLSWPEGANRAQQAAREARYAALCDYARQIGALVVATAHSADDQAETVFMRAGAGSSWRGLAGIAPFASAPIWPEGRGLYVVRPLLGARREQLRAYLRGQDAAWIEDPANANPKFERVRIRARLAELEGAGFDPMRLVALAARLRTRADTLDRDAATLIARAVIFEQWRTVIRFETWTGPEEVRWWALSALIAAASGASRAPSSVSASKIERQIMAPDFRGITHSGVHLRPADQGVALEREHAAFMGRGAQKPREPMYVVLAPGLETLWDGRYAVTARVGGWRLARSGVRFVLDRRDAAYATMPRPKVRSLILDHIQHALGAVNPLQPS